MAGFQQARDALLLALDDELIEEDEFLMLYNLNTSKNPNFPYHDYEKFDLDQIDEAECKAEFRVEKNDLPLLFNALGIPETIECRQGSICDGMEGLCMLLRRLAYPCRYSDMISRFPRPVPVLSMITTTVMDYVYQQHHHRISHWNRFLLEPRKLEEYAMAISQQGSALDNCFGFIDGTVRPICRPGENQRIVYNGHKRVHALKYQSVVVPSGMIAVMHGPFGVYYYYSIPFYLKENLKIKVDYFFMTLVIPRLNL